MDPKQPDKKTYANVGVQCDKTYANIGVQCDDSDTTQEETTKQLDDALQGRRLVGILSLTTMIQAATQHATLCKKGPVKFKGSKKLGLSCKIIFTCGCNKKFAVGTDDENVSLTANEALAWGCQVSAIGFDDAAKLLACLDLPTPCATKFRKIQNSLYDDLCKASNENMSKWAKQEADIAIANGNYATVEGIKYPAITVVVDGGWSKRSYGHSFSSNAGCAVIIGANTRKVIYADSRISTCSLCQRKRNSDTPVPIHKCFKNWNKSPTSMESDIILEGFMSSIKMYNLVYNRFIGDGDSSVFSKVAKVYHGMEVQKVECMNHVVKNLTSRLMEIARNQVKGNDSPNIPILERRRLQSILPRIKTGVRCAIIYNNKQGNHWSALREDILNVPKHVFGEHSVCKEYFCDKENPKSANVYEIAKNMICMVPLLKAINRVADLSESLIYAQTSNPAETFMSVAARYTEGKRKNFGQRYLYNLRMIGAVFSYNETSFWATEAFRMIKGHLPCDFWIKQSSTTEKSRNRKPTLHKVSRRLTFPTYAVAGDWDYGSNPKQWDLPADVMTIKINEKRAELQITPQEIAELEKATRLQAECPEWHMQRKQRVTASKAGRIQKLKDTTNNTDILNTIFGKKRFGKNSEVAMKYGRDNEQIAIMEYEVLHGNAAEPVQQCGLFVDESHGELAASPDGLIGVDGMIEVKCPHALFTHQKPALSWPEVNKQVCSFFINKQNQPELKPNHEHFFQVIMQLHITKRDWCDYFVWSPYCSGVLIRVYREPTTDAWLKLREKLLKFWEHDMAPEIVNSRFLRGISEHFNPPYRSQTQKGLMPAGTNQSTQSNTTKN